MCDHQLSQYVRRNGLAPVAAADEPFFRGGVLQVPSNPNIRMARTEDGTTTTLTLTRVPSFGGAQGTDLVNTQQEIVVRRLPDQTIQLNRRFVGGTAPAQGIQGAEVVFDDRQGRCDMLQFVVDQRVGTQSGRVVSFDRKYCQAVQGALAKAGQTKVRECGALMSDLASAYRDRGAELAKENKLMTDIQMGSGMFAVVPPVQSNSFQVMSLLSACSPPDWSDLQREMMASAQRLMQPVAPAPQPGRQPPGPGSPAAPAPSRQ
jgi:hypothetical protein